MFNVKWILLYQWNHLQENVNKPLIFTDDAESVTSEKETVLAAALGSVPRPKLRESALNGSYTETLDEPVSCLM